MPSRIYTTLIDVANGQYGYVTSDDARALGVDPAQLRLMHHRGVLDRLSVGLYRFPIVPTTALDHYMEATLWPRTPTVLSHETALDLHDVCDVNPARIHLTVPPRYRLRRDLPAMYEMHLRDLDPIDVTLHEGIPIVTVRRAILDGIDAGLGGHLIDQAVATAERRGLLGRDDLDAITALRESRLGISQREAGA
jgi:predicted transcriptional regulator of viral defense system